MAFFLQGVVFIQHGFNDDIDLDGLFGNGKGVRGNNKHFNSLLRKALLFQFEKRFTEWI